MKFEGFSEVNLWKQINRPLFERFYIHNLPCSDGSINMTLENCKHNELELLDDCFECIKCKKHFTFDQVKIMIKDGVM